MYFFSVLPPPEVSIFDGNDNDDNNDCIVIIVAVFYFCSWSDQTEDYVFDRKLSCDVVDVNKGCAWYGNWSMGLYEGRLERMFIVVPWKVVHSGFWLWIEICNRANILRLLRQCRVHKGNVIGALACMTFQLRLTF